MAAETITGEIEQWANIAPTKWKSFRTACLISEMWFGYFSKDLNEVNKIILDFPAGTTVKIEYLTKGDFYNLLTITKVEGTVQSQLPLPEEMEQKIVSKTATQKVTTPPVDQVTRQPLTKVQLTKLMLGHVRGLIEYWEGVENWLEGE